jgi:hypothetical protein
LISEDWKRGFVCGLVLAGAAWALGVGSALAAAALFQSLKTQ